MRKFLKEILVNVISDFLKKNMHYIISALFIIAQFSVFLFHHVISYFSASEALVISGCITVSAILVGLFAYKKSINLDKIVDSINKEKCDLLDRINEFEKMSSYVTFSGYEWDVNEQPYCVHGNTRIPGKIIVCPGNHEYLPAENDMSEHLEVYCSECAFSNFEIDRTISFRGVSISASTLRYILGKLFAGNNVNEIEIPKNEYESL